MSNDPNLKPASIAINHVTRRSFLGQSAPAVAVLFATATESEAQQASDANSRRAPRRAAAASSFLDLLRAPDSVTTYGRFEKTLPADPRSLDRHAETWSRGDVTVEATLSADSLVLALQSPSTPVSVVHVRWRLTVTTDLIVLGDAWERSYGDLGWRNIIPERVMPWYFATHDHAACHGYGVMTDARALCFWQIDPAGVSLWLNVCNGGNGVALGERRLVMATIASHRGQTGESAFEAVRALCRRLCARPARPTTPIYGVNDWCYSYGRSTAASILRDTDFVAELSPSGGVRPFSVIDGGWVDRTPSWPDMARLAADIRTRTARPGLWVRPLEAPRDAAATLLLSKERFGANAGRARELAYDPTVPEALARITEKLKQAAAWGYDMVKHDFTTYDLLGQWGFEMGPQPTLPGWSLHDRSRTNAEVIADLYIAIREAVGPRLLLDGCNTVGHLGQGLFDLQRTGDDTSGRQWERTRRMGVNTLAFRLPQHGTYFTVDADVVGITEAIPWEFNRQWLDVLARSGTATLVSAGPPARGADQRSALREAFAIASTGGVGATPLDWIETGTPAHWRPGRIRAAGQERRYAWSGRDGASAFLSP